MSDISKFYIGKEDFQIQTNTAAAETFERKTSVGGTMNLTKFPDLWDGTGRLNIALIESILSTLITANITTGNITTGNITTVNSTTINTDIIATPATDPGDITEVISDSSLTHDVLKTKINELLAAMRVAGFFT